jgi:hypothetical protein
MRFIIAAALLVALAMPAHAGARRHHGPSGVLAPLYGGGYTPLDCAATVFPAPRWCRHCWPPRRAVSIVRRI